MAWLNKILFDIELGQDDWSLQKLRFGKNSQLEVIGLYGAQKDGHVNYVLNCTVCSTDSEMYEDGLFYSTKSALKRGSIPCGCKPGGGSLTESQWFLLCKRKAEENGYKFSGWASEFIGQKTPLLLICDLHGEWRTTVISNLIHRSDGCLTCRDMRRRTPYEESVKSFMDSGSFVEGTIFTKLEKRNSYGERPYWKVDCPSCGESGESKAGSLREGRLCCACSKNRPKEAYINFVYDTENLLGVKFGISVNPKRRLNEQLRNNNLNIIQKLVFKFETRDKCKSAEKACKDELDCGILSKEEMPDGYSETTEVGNIDAIVKIYQRFGGELITGV